MEGIQSIRLSHLESILELLCQEMKRVGLSKLPGGYTSEELKNYLLQTSTHIPQRFLDLFSVDAADDILTYMWLGTPILCLAPLLRRRAHGVDIRVWVDVVFNDQRSPQAITRAVSAANTFYMRATSHTVIFSEAEYPAFDERGTQVAPRKCQPWDRCWCQAVACGEGAAADGGPDCRSHDAVAALRPGSAIARRRALGWRR